MRTASETKPFWPDAVPPLHHPEHQAQLNRWLLELLPMEMRSHAVLIRYLPALLHVADSYINGALSGVRSAYATARVDLAATLPPESIAATLKSIAETGVQLRKQAEFIAHMKEHYCID